VWGGSETEAEPSAGSTPSAANLDSEREHASAPVEDSTDSSPVSPPSRSSSVRKKRPPVSDLFAAGETAQPAPAPPAEQPESDASQTPDSSPTAKPAGKRRKTGGELPDLFGGS
jgi:hypothetical protein